jgi:hypothetical protein
MNWIKGEDVTEKDSAGEAEHVRENRSLWSKYSGRRNYKNKPARKPGRPGYFPGSGKPNSLNLTWIYLNHYKFEPFESKL